MKLERLALTGTLAPNNFRDRVPWEPCNDAARFFPDKNHIEEISMATLRTRLATVAVAFTVTLTGLVPAQAFQMPAPVAPAASAAPVTDVQYRNDRWDRRDRWNRDRGFDRRAYYNGHRGYRERRAGYRYRNGFWYPLAAFGAGAIIGGAIAQDRPRARGYSPAHYRWCESRYRTYRASDNSYVPSAGVRASCNSPY